MGVIMNTIIKEVEKNISKVKSIGEYVRKIENEVFNLSLKWPPKTYWTDKKKGFAPEVNNT